jgi:hypothetical protein
MIFWTAGFVLLTLMVQAPMLPAVLRWAGLAKLPPGEVKRRRELVAALAEHTDEVLQELRQDEEMLSGGCSGAACLVLPAWCCLPGAAWLGLPGWGCPAGAAVCLE